MTFPGMTGPRFLAFVTVMLVVALMSVSFISCLENCNHTAGTESVTDSNPAIKAMLQPVNITPQQVMMPVHYTPGADKLSGIPTVYFSETGLALGVEWYVLVDNQYHYSQTSTVEFNISAGNYTFFMGCNYGYTPDPSSITATISGSDSFSIVFNESYLGKSPVYTYPYENVTSAIVESGPNAPTSWIGQTVSSPYGFLTVGGNGFSFYDPATGYAYSSTSTNGFLLGAAYHAGLFVLSGSGFGPGNGVELYTYNPVTGYTSDLTGEILSKSPGLDKNAYLTNVAYSSGLFFIYGEDGLSGGGVGVTGTASLLFTYNPLNGSIQNITGSADFPALTSTEMIGTPSGIYLMGGMLNVQKVGLFNYNNSTLSDLSSLIPANFSYSGLGENINMGAVLFRAGGMIWYNGTLYIGGETPKLALLAIHGTTSRNIFDSAGISVMGTNLSWYKGMITSISTSGNSIFAFATGNANNGTSTTDGTLLFRIGIGPAKVHAENISYVVPEFHGSVSATFSAFSNSAFLSLGSRLGRVEFGLIENLSDVELANRVALVNFTEYGFVSGRSWTVVVNSFTYSTSARSLLVKMPEALQSIYIPASEGLAVRNFRFELNVTGPLTVNLDYAQTQYVYFVATSLDGQIPWGISIENQTFTNHPYYYTNVYVNHTLINESKSQVYVELAPGNYSYAVVNEFHADAYFSNSSGRISLEGGTPKMVSLDIHIKLYSVAISSGINRLEWSVRLSGPPILRYLGKTSFSFNVTNASMLLPNGTYSMSFSSTPSYYPASSVVTFSVNGSGGNVSNPYLHGYTVTFLFPGKIAWVVSQMTIRNFTYSIRGNSTTFGLPAGSYSYSIQSMGENSPSAPNGTLDVSGNTTVSVPFVRKNLPVTFQVMDMPGGVLVSIDGKNYSISHSHPLNIYLPFGLNSIRVMSSERYYRLNYIINPYNQSQLSMLSLYTVNVTGTPPNYFDLYFYQVKYQLLVNILNLQNKSPLSGYVVYNSTSPPPIFQSSIASLSYLPPSLTTSYGQFSVSLAYGNYTIHLNSTKGYYLTRAVINVFVDKYIYLYVRAYKIQTPGVYDYLPGLTLLGMFVLVAVAAVYTRRRYITPKDQLKYQEIPYKH